MQTVIKAAFDPDIGEFTYTVLDETEGRTFTVQTTMPFADFAESFSVEFDLEDN